MVQPLVKEAEEHVQQMEATATQSFKALLKEAGVGIRSRWRDIKDQVRSGSGEKGGRRAAAVRQQGRVGLCRG